MNIDRATLLEALEGVKGAVADKAFMPIYTHVLVSNDVVLGYDSEIGVRVKLPESIGGTFNVKFAPFLNLVKSLDDEMLEINVETKKRVTLKCGGHKSVLMQIEEEFPRPVVRVDGKGWIDIPAGFKEALERTIIAASENEQDRELSGVLLEGSQMYATNRSKAARCTIEGLAVPKCLLSRKAVQEVIRLGNPKRMVVTDRLAVFDYVNLTLLTNLREGAQNYPPVAKLFEGRTGTCPVPEKLVGALSRLLIFTQKDAPQVLAQCNPMGLELQSVGGEATANEWLELPPTKFEGRRAFNPELMRPALEYAESMDWAKDEQDLFYLTGPVANFEYLIAPTFIAK